MSPPRRAGTGGAHPCPQRPLVASPVVPPAGNPRAVPTGVPSVPRRCPPHPAQGGTGGVPGVSPRCPHAVSPPALLEATRVLLLLSVVAAAAGVALGLPLGTRGARRARERAAGATLLLAGLLALAGLGLGSGGSLALLGPPRSSWSFSWSFILAWVAAALLGSAGIFHICSASKDPSPESSEAGGS
ncbi:lens fiber membrane intrinsic protein [Motacilla alba alba]|uniref:lens fiber membrane intrinsic protein n=1 Tax=Motacilla alba alba TaxID=1094192 RepID=UPI0018D54097|nr:lens fiber membrane intrinsic protein [Motacilla alba alba]